VTDGGRRIGIAAARFNDAITVRLVTGARAALRAAGVPDEDVCEVWVPGAFELPLAARALLLHGRVDAVVALGAVIRGDTTHYDFVAGECARGLQQVQLDIGSPVVFGVLTTENTAQAIDRASVARMDKGGEAAATALEMLDALDAIERYGKSR